MSLDVRRSSIRFYPNSKRVITRFFDLGNDSRKKNIIKNILSLSTVECNFQLNQVLREFSNRHRNITKVFKNHFEKVQDIVASLDIDVKALPREKKLLIGAFFTNEYSLESTAFFNPSIVEDPYQGNLSKGEKRVILSFRATGEGHISSIAFRNGILSENNQLNLEEPGDLVDMPEFVTRFEYEKSTFLSKLDEMNIKKDVIGTIMDKLDEKFTYGLLLGAIDSVIKNQELSYSRKKVIQAMKWLACSHYEVTFSMDTAISDRVLFPVSYAEKNGIEDARFVKFVDDDGSVTYYATYTAYDGYAILPKLIETKDFYHFVVKPLHGDYAQNKGLALFPRKINGSYAMLSRIDGVSNYVMFSDDITLWDSASIIQSPKYPWEFVQIGNAGSPIETEYGWLVITHSVGPVRTYSLGAILLDLDDPTRLIARLKEPLLKANEKEREGYVPNAIYSCGVMIHNGEVIIPYAMSDFASSIATISLENLLSEMVTENNTSFKDFLNTNKTSILLADDDATIRRLLTKFLSEQGFLVTAVSDGIDALMLLGREKFDLVLSDVGMPNFDGFQLLRLMNEKGIDIPVVFLTGNYTSESLEKSAALGAVEYIKKPVKVDELLKILNRLLVISQ